MSLTDILTVILHFLVVTNCQNRHIKIGLMAYTSQYTGPDAIGPFENTAAAVTLALEDYRIQEGLHNVNIRYFILKK